jgi:hypothetical protein
MECPSVSDASEKSKEKKKSDSKERKSRFGGQNSSIKKSSIDLHKLNKELKLNQKMKPGYAVSSLTLHQFEAI